MNIKALGGSIVLAMSLCSASYTHAADDILYSLKDTVTLPSVNTDWDYIKVQPGSSRLFMARDKDGLTVFDMDTLRVVTTLENSKGANGPVLLPQYNRGYVANTDGSLLIFDLNALKPLSRIQLSNDSGINSGSHDPFTKRVHFITGTREKGAVWYSFDAATGKALGQTVFPFHKMDDPAPDGEGHLYAPARYDQLILKLDSLTLKEVARWSVGCNVSKVRYQIKSKRIYAACGGRNPQFFVLNPETGEITSRIPIGKGLDGLVIDESRGRVVTSNGEDGTLSVIGRIDADTFALLGTISTRIGARMMDMDPRTGQLFAVTADYTLTPGPKVEDKPTQTYHPNSFTVLIYAPDK